MQILIAQHAGFCEGVERAYRVALEQIQTSRPVFMLGKLVHNTQVVEKFEKAGVKTVNTIAEIPAQPKGTVIFSAHGVPPQVYDQAKELGFAIIDTSCGWVKKAQRIAKQLADQGHLVIIVGDQGHVEVKGLLGWSGPRAQVIEGLADVKALKADRATKIGVLAQTTQSEKHFNKIVAALKQKYPQVQAHNTICDATAKRQSAAVELANQVGLMLIIGDKMSANTKRLAELCAQTGTPTHQIQTVQELDPGWLVGKFKVGLTAGASTPDWVIKEVVEKLNVC